METPSLLLLTTLLAFAFKASVAQWTPAFATFYGGSDASAAKDARPSGYTPVSRTPMTPSLAPLDAGSSPDDSESRRKDGVRVVCSSCMASGTTASTEPEDARRVAWRGVSRAAKPSNTVW